MTSKQAERARLRAVRDAAEAVTLGVPAPFMARLRPGLIVATYWPVGSEADPDPLARAAANAGCALALPHVTDRVQPLRFLSWDGGEALAPGPFGLQQPRPDAPDVAPDIILAPLVGFDRRGNRIGQGAGHYDRAFAAHPDAWRVGIALSVQEVSAIAADPWDVPLHAIVTEREWIET